MNFLIIIFFLFLSLFQPAILTEAQEAWETRPQDKQELAAAKQKVVYSFLDVFPQARAIRYPKFGKTEGSWVEDHFEFSDAPGLSDIFIGRNFEVNATVHESIAWKIQPDVASNLIFTRVPPGRKLKLFLAMPDIAFKKEKVWPIQLEAWIGGKKILESEIQAKGWRQEEVDLTVPFLLQRSYVVSFKVYSTAKEETLLLFRGSIE